MPGVPGVQCVDARSLDSEPQLLGSIPVSLLRKNVEEGLSVADMVGWVTRHAFPTPFSLARFYCKSLETPNVHLPSFPCS